MDVFTKDQLGELARTQGNPCISLFMPTYHVEAELAQNPIRLKNLVKRLRQELRGHGYRDPEVEELVAPVEGLFGNDDFWLHQSDGLAIFAAPGVFQTFRLPSSFEELVVVNRRFHLKPLFPSLSGDEQFYILALSVHNVRLFRATRFTVDEVESSEIPKHIAGTIAGEIPEATHRLTVRHIGSGNKGNEPMYHGHGGDPADEKAEPRDEIKRFFRDVSDGLRATLGGATAPLVLAGVEYYLPHFRMVNGYAHLVEDAIIGGNPDLVKPQELHARAWEIVEPIFRQGRERAAAQFNQRIHTDSGLASDDLREIVPAAVFSRIDALFVPEGTNIWGRYDEANNLLEVHDTLQPGDEDLLDLAVLHTYLHGGSVHIVPPEEMPGGSSLAATFRFPADVTAEAR